MKPGEPFSAIVQSESMSYSSIVDRQREDENDVDDERDERKETSDQRFFFILGPERALPYCTARLHLYARILTGRSLPRDRHACRHATPPAPFLRLGVRLAPARGIHGAASGGVVAAPSLARPYIFRTPFCVSTCMCLLRRRTEVRVTPTL